VAYISTKVKVVVVILGIGMCSACSVSRLAAMAIACILWDQLGRRIILAENLLEWKAKHCLCV